MIKHDRLLNEALKNQNEGNYLDCTKGSVTNFSLL